MRRRGRDIVRSGALRRWAKQEVNVMKSHATAAATLVGAALLSAAAAVAQTATTPGRAKPHAWRSFGVGYSRNLNRVAPIPLRFAPYGLRPITAPLAAGASNQTVSTCRNPASSSHAEYSAGV